MLLQFNSIASNINTTKTIKYPLPLDVWHSLLHEVINTSLLFFLNYIQAPSIIINKINNTNTIAADDDPQFPIKTILLFSSFTLFYGK